MSFRHYMAKVIVEALIKAACWLLRAQELPPLTLPPPSPKPKVCNCLECREERLGRLFVLDGFLACALRTCRWVGHDMDTRWKQ